MFDEEKEVIKATIKQAVNRCVNSYPFWVYMCVSVAIFIILFFFVDTSEYAPYIFRQLGILAITSLILAVPVQLVLAFFYYVDRQEREKQEEYYNQFMSEEEKEYRLNLLMGEYREAFQPIPDTPQPEQTEAINHRPKKNRKKGYVYILNEINGEHYKIGRTRNPDNRLRTFSVKLPYKVEYDLLIPTNDMYALETRLHNKYAPQRVDGEWFTLTPDDLHWLRTEFDKS